MPRLRALPPAKLDEQQRALYDQVASGKRAAGPQLFRLTSDDGSLTGPFNVFLHAPRIGAALNSVGEAVRYGSQLSARIRELAILAVAGYRDSEFERYAHERLGKAIGLTDAEMTAAGDLGDLELDDPDEAAAYEFCRQALRDRVVKDEIYAAAEERLGEQQVVELTALIGYYDALALLLSVFEIGVPEEPAALDDDTGTRQDGVDR